VSGDSKKVSGDSKKVSGDSIKGPHLLRQDGKIYRLELRFREFGLCFELQKDGNRTELVY